MQVVAAGSQAGVGEASSLEGAAFLEVRRCSASTHAHAHVLLLAAVLAAVLMKISAACVYSYLAHMMPFKNLAVPSPHSLFCGTPPASLDTVNMLCHAVLFACHAVPCCAVTGGQRRRPQGGGGHPGAGGGGGGGGLYDGDSNVITLDDSSFPSSGTGWVWLVSDGVMVEQ